MDSPKPLLDHVLLFSPISGAHEGYGDCDLLEVGLDVLHRHFHGLVDVTAESDLPHKQMYKQYKAANSRRGVTPRTFDKELSRLFCTGEFVSAQVVIGQIVQPIRSSPFHHEARRY